MLNGATVTAPRLGDWAQVVDILGQEHVLKASSEFPAELTHDDMIHDLQYATANGGHVGVMRVNGSVIGVVLNRKMNGRVFQCHPMVHERYLGQGVATNLIAANAEFMLAEADKLYAFPPVTNDKTIKAFRNNGFILEGVMRFSWRTPTGYVSRLVLGRSLCQQAGQ